MTAPTVPSLHCPPGTKMILEVAGIEDKLQSLCAGYLRSRCVITQMPLLAEANREALYQLLYPGAGVIARYLHEGTVIGFSAKIIKWIQVPFPLIFLTYPPRLESMDLRRHKRISCCFPGQVRLGEASFTGMVLDLSLSGCQFSTITDGAAPAVRVDDVMELRCELFGAASDACLPCAVMRVSTAGRRLEVGLKFRTLPPAASDALGAYLQAALSVLG
ncbi:PilZ domain-containing protein [Solidesulfovibrio alcoholivorans]|uniref:PilZ domain-containing protein n=1 Tax=Solidesulfovibrio alcoholivorans TaxID=81406 RepID=UPI0004970144|nr:flagellar brake protein [Solidesulfovibrio alcoholivorans]